MAIAEKDDLPKLKIPHVIQEVVEKAGKSISSKVSEDKKSIEEKSTAVQERKLSGGSKEKDEQKEGHPSATSAKSAKSDENESKTSLHPHDSMLMEHGEATIEKEDLPNLKI